MEKVDTIYPTHARGSEIASSNAILRGTMALRAAGIINRVLTALVCKAISFEHAVKSINFV